MGIVRPTIAPVLRSRSHPVRHSPMRFPIAAGVMLLTFACGGRGAPAPPMTAPTPPPPGPPVPNAVLAGSWQGRATDSQGDTDVAWSLTQTGDMVSGTVTTQAVNRDDGSCNSCHRNKSGSVAGA